MKTWRVIGFVVCGMMSLAMLFGLPHILISVLTEWSANPIAEAARLVVDLGFLALVLGGTYVSWRAIKKDGNIF